MTKLSKNKQTIQGQKQTQKSTQKKLERLEKNIHKKKNKKQNIVFNPGFLLIHFSLFWCVTYRCSIRIHQWL
jgi:stalled ribosome rescue protein Dom34